jgi:hypothetical protein
MASVNHHDGSKNAANSTQTAGAAVVIPPGGEEEDDNLLDEGDMPVRAQHRTIRSAPDPEEPSFSYEDKMSYLMMDEKTGSIEEDFYGRLRNGPRRESGGGSGSFWRTSDAGSPSFNSVHLRGKSSSESGPVDGMKGTNGSSGSLLGVAIAEHEKTNKNNKNSGNISSHSKSSSASISAMQAVRDARTFDLSPECLKAVNTIVLVGSLSTSFF